LNAYAEIGTRRRIGSALLVALLHLLVVLGLMHNVTVTPRVITPPETLIRLTKLAPPPPSTPPAPPVPTLAQPSPGIVQAVPLPAIAPPPTLDLRGFGQRLFGCAPDALAGLTQEERTRCNTGPTRPDDTASLMPRSHVKNPERRNAELAAKNTTARIPCSYVAVERSFGYQVPAASLDCLYNSATGAGLAPLSGLGK
jgi:hypothetical protein